MMSVSSSSKEGNNEQQWTAAVDRVFQELLDNANESKQERLLPSCLHRSDIVGLLEQAAKCMNINVEWTIIEDAVDTLLDDVQEKSPHSKGGESVGEEDYYNQLSKEQFRNLFRIHPNLFRCIQDDDFQIQLPNSTKTSPALDHVQQGKIARNFQGTTEWKNNGKAWIWYCMYFVANLVAFSYKAYCYINRPEATEVFGTCIVVARSSAQCINLNSALILLPVCRHLLTRFRGANKHMRKIFPFDSVLQYHMFIGLVILLFTSLHVGAHICDMHRFAHASEQAIMSLFGTKLGNDIPSGVGERWKLIVQSRAGITGIIMIVCMAIAYPMTQIRRNCFNTFWFTHQLLLIMLVTLCFHGTQSLLEPFQSVYWIMVPLACYLVPRFLRETPMSECSVLSVAIQRGNVMRIRLTKPKSWEKQLHAGMYAYINIPQVSRLEWHPFTMTSAPSDRYIEFHCRRVGDWTGKVHDLLEECKTAKMMKTMKEVDMESGTESTETESSCSSDNSLTESSVPSSSWSLPRHTCLSDLVVKVDGPIGAPSQGYSHFPIVVLVAAGIGVTPMISVLKELLDKPGKMKRVFFYWIVRDHESFEWFGSLMQDIYDEAYDEQNQQVIMHIRPFLTSVSQDDTDLGAVLFQNARKAQHKKTNFDLLLNHYSHYQADIGRPNWQKELMLVKEYAKDELGHSKCGVFLCGPDAMANQVSKECIRQSKHDKDFHFYFSKETF